MNKWLKTASGSSQSHNGEVQCIWFTVHVLLTHFGSILHSRKKPTLQSGSHTSNAEDSTNLWWYFFWIEDIPLCFDSKSKTKSCTTTVKTQQCINISILLWQHVLVLLDCLQASNQQYEVQSVHIVCCRILYYLQGVHREFKII